MIYPMGLFRLLLQDRARRLYFFPVNEAIDFQNARSVVELFQRAATCCRTDRHRSKSVVRLPAKGRLIATGDLHDNPYHLEKILKAARLDESVDHHVIFHELIHGENLINGMDFSYRMLARVAELQCRYPDQVHPLLANHELAQMLGQGVSKGAGDSVLQFQEALEFAFADQSSEVERAINEFLAAWPIALITERGVLCAHSLPAPHAMKVFDSTILERDLVEADYVPRTGSAYLMVWGRKHTAEHLDHLAKLFGVEVFCLGHEHAESGSMPVGHQAIVLNSDHEQGVILPIDLSATPDRDAWLWEVRPLSSFG